MDTVRPSGRLFWKLLLALWVSNLASLVATAVYFHYTDPRPPLGNGLQMILGFLPIAPLVSGAVAILVTGWGIALYLLRPLNALRWALRRVAAGQLDTRVAHQMGRRNDEIVDLAQDFDRMAEQLQRLTESRRVLLHDISHELRSPLGRMQAAIGLVRQSPDQTEALVERIERETTRLDTLIEELLTLHRLEADRPLETAHSRVDLVELLQAIAEDADFEARSADRAVTFRAEGPCVADVNGELIYRAFENVVRNAVKFTAPGTLVDVSARRSVDGASLHVRVEDRGPGVPPHLLQAIFEPFVRVEGSEHVRGVGLGLAIARRAVLLHGGQISAALRSGGGLSMEVRLPVAAPGA